VIIPVFNGQAYLAEALHSVLDQGVQGLEVIVVDDGSTDGTADVVSALRDPRMRSVRQPRQGAAAARNCGVALAGGHIIAFLDADDLWLPGKLCAQVASLERGDGDMIFSHIDEFVSPDCRGDSGFSGQARGELTGACAPTLLMRKSDFERVGDFDPACGVGEFIDWHARAIDAGLRPFTLPRVLARRRVHRSNTTRGAAGYAMTMKRILDRRRAAS
jgi:glycosyltransferase involved in cell wall biosynthesis